MYLIKDSKIVKQLSIQARIWSCIKWIVHPNNEKARFSNRIACLSSKRMGQLFLPHAFHHFEVGAEFVGWYCGRAEGAVTALLYRMHHRAVSGQLSLELFSFLLHLVERHRPIVHPRKDTADMEYRWCSRCTNQSYPFR